MCSTTSLMVAMNNKVGLNPTLINFINLCHILSVNAQFAKRHGPSNQNKCVLPCMPQEMENLQRNFLVIPSSVPSELHNLTQVKEMLIARALQIMRVYIIDILCCMKH
jgi:hypothetical protein